MIKHWVSGYLYIGNVNVGAARLDAHTPEGGPDRFCACSHMPGIQSWLGHHSSLQGAQKAVEQAAARSLKQMFGCSPREIGEALKTGPELTKAARALYTVAHWTPDRDIHAGAFWEALRAALSIDPSRAPSPATNTPQAQLLAKAKALRAAQREYMADRRNDEKGKAVAEAADALDSVIARMDPDTPDTEEFNPIE